VRGVGARVSGRGVVVTERERGRERAVGSDATREERGANAPQKRRVGRRRGEGVGGARATALHRRRGGGGRLQVRSIQKFFTHRSVSTFDLVPFQLTDEKLFLYGMALQSRVRGAPRQARRRGVAERTRPNGGVRIRDVARGGAPSARVRRVRARRGARRARGDARFRRVHIYTGPRTTASAW